MSRTSASSILKKAAAAPGTAKMQRHCPCDASGHGCSLHADEMFRSQPSELNQRVNLWLINAMYAGY